MAIPVAIAGPLKKALKTAIKKTLPELANISISDPQALILNRLKTAPNRALYEFTSKELGIPIEEVRKVVKAFNQTPKMREASLGKTFTDLAKSKINYSGQKTIKGLMRYINEINAERRTPEETQEVNNKRIKDKLRNLTKAVDKKINGATEAQDKYGKTYTFKTDYDFRLLFDATKNYSKSTFDALDKVLSNIENDIEFYDPGSGYEPLLVEILNNDWEVYTQNSAERYLQDIKLNVESALNLPEEGDINV